MRAAAVYGSMGAMTGGSHTVVIELDATEGPPQGRITVDGIRQQPFEGWIDLTARLESLRHRSLRRAGAAGDADGFKTPG